MTQRRQDGSVDLNRTWLVYEVGHGFRMLSSEFVLVQVKALIHCLTGQDGWEMRMDVILVNGTNIIL